MGTESGQAVRLAVRAAVIAGTFIFFDVSGGQQAGTAGTPANAEPPPVAVEIAAVRVAPAREEVRVVGSLAANEAVVLRPEIAGRILTVNFTEGERIERGQSMFTLDPAEYQAQAAASEAATKLWELKFARAGNLLAKNVLSQQEYDETQATFKEAQAKLALDRVRLEKTVIRAPFGGVIGLRQVSPGDFVQVGQALVNLEAIEPIKIDFNIPERYASQIKPGQSFTVAVAAYRERAFTGEVYAIDPRLDEAGRTLRLRGRVPNQSGELRPGMFSRVTLTIGERPEALWVPEQALVPRGNDQYVYRVENGRALLTRIEIGERRVGEVEIRDGLKAGDGVVTAGQTKLRDQANVRVINETGTEPTAQR